jgi:hypothetical protein
MGKLLGDSLSNSLGYGLGLLETKLESVLRIGLGTELGTALGEPLGSELGSRHGAEMVKDWMGLGQDLEQGKFIIINSFPVIRGFRGACYVFFTSKIHAIKKMKKNAPLWTTRLMLTTAQNNTWFDQERDQNNVNLVHPV